MRDIQICSQSWCREVNSNINLYCKFCGKPLPARFLALLSEPGWEIAVQAYAMLKEMGPTRKDGFKARSESGVEMDLYETHISFLLDLEWIEVVAIEHVGDGTQARLLPVFKVKPGINIEDELRWKKRLEQCYEKKLMGLAQMVAQEEETKRKLREMQEQNIGR